MLFRTLENCATRLASAATITQNDIQAFSLKARVAVTIIFTLVITLVGRISPEQVKAPQSTQQTAVVTNLH